MKGGGAEVTFWTFENGRGLPKLNNFEQVGVAESTFSDKTVIKSETVMSWSSREKKEDIVYIVYCLKEIII